MSLLVPRPHPFIHFDEWFAEARARDPQPEAAALATVDAEGRPSNRVVLVRRWDTRGFEVFTNLRSRKGREVAAMPRAALAFHWKPLGRQVRIEGLVAPMSAEESDAYWRGRPRGSQVSAVASEQSEPIESRDALLAQRDAVEARYPDSEPVPRPAHWGGLRLVPLVVEFWQHEDDRYHQRLEYRRSAPGTPWTTRILQP